MEGEIEIAFSGCSINLQRDASFKASLKTNIKVRCGSKMEGWGRKKDCGLKTKKKKNISSCFT